MKILKKESLSLGGFAGIKEHRLVVDKRIGGSDNTWDGLGNFVYLADAYYNPYGQSNMHSHSEIDIISVIVKGRVNHEGSLKNGESLVANQVQVQRAGEPASYKLYNLKEGNITHVYGGFEEETKTLNSHTILEVGILTSKQKISKTGNFLLYVTQGSGNINDTIVNDGDLVQGIDLELEALDDGMQVIIISKIYEDIS